MNMQKNMKKNKTRKGFTLVELIVVIAILAVLAAAAIAGYAGVTANARSAQASSNAATIVNAVNNHNSVTGAAAVTALPTGITAGSAVQTWNLSIRVGGALTAAPAGLAAAPAGITTANAVDGPVDLDILVSMTGDEWTAAVALINPGSIWSLK